MEYILFLNYILNLFYKVHSSESYPANFIKPPHSTKIKLGTKKKSGSFLNLKKNSFDMINCIMFLNLEQHFF